MSVLDGSATGGAPAARRAHGVLGPPAGRLLAVVAAAVVGIAAFIPLIQDSGATTKGYELRDLERERNEWRARVHDLESEVAALGSTERVRREATERLGMAPPAKTIYLGVGVPAPPLGRVPSRYLSEGAVGQDEDATRMCGSDCPSR
jgi:cell division protein FtsL